MRADRVLRSRVRRRVVVSLKSGVDFVGVLTDSDRQSLVLQQAVQHTPDAEVPADGEIVVLLADVAYLQYP